MSTKHEAAFLALQSTASSDRYNAVRFIKNSIIGNKTKKVMYMMMGVVPRMVEILSQSHNDPNLKIQAAVVLGSFAYGNDQNIENLVQAGAIVPLLDALADADKKLLEAAARALKAIFQNASVPRDDVFRPKYIQSLIRLLSFVNTPNANLAELGASILARCCETHEHQTLIASAGALPLLIQMVHGSHPKSQEAALDALGALARDNVELAKSVLEACNKDDSPKLIPMVIRLLHDSRPNMRLIAATALTYIYRTGVIPEHQTDMSLHVLPVLVKLLNESNTMIQIKAPLILAYLVSETDEMQKAAAECDAIGKLAHMLTTASQVHIAEDHTSSTTDRLKESALLAIAAVCSLREECRKQVIDAKVLSMIVQAMEHKNVGVRAAACQCTRSLSRSVKNLRTSLVDAGVALPLFKLLSDESVGVQTTASATLCNIVLDFSPMKKTVLENGGVERLVALVNSMDGNLRLNTVWALKNLLFQAESDIKTTVMKQLTYGTLEALICDQEAGIQEQALNLLRNLACGKESDIQAVFDGLGEKKLMDVLEQKLNFSQDEIILQTLYVIVNVSTGNETHKSSIMNNERILQHILRFMDHDKATVRVATIWCIINLTWPEDPGSEMRVSRLKMLGFESKLGNMVDDLDLDVKDRVKTALQHFSSGVVSMQV